MLSVWRVQARNSLQRCVLPQQCLLFQQTYRFFSSLFFDNAYIRKKYQQYYSSRTLTVIKHLLW